MCPRVLRLPTVAFVELFVSHSWECPSWMKVLALCHYLNLDRAIAFATFTWSASAVFLLILLFAKGPNSIQLEYQFYALIFWPWQCLVMRCVIFYPITAMIKIWQPSFSGCSTGKHQPGVLCVVLSIALVSQHQLLDRSRVCEPSGPRNESSSHRRPAVVYCEFKCDLEPFDRGIFLVFCSSLCLFLQLKTDDLFQWDETRGTALNLGPPRKKKSETTCRCKNHQEMLVLLNDTYLDRLWCNFEPLGDGWLIHASKCQGSSFTTKLYKTLTKLYIYTVVRKAKWWKGCC